jgi:hypothetical protein
MEAKMRQQEMTSTLQNCLGTDISEVMFANKKTIIFNASLNHYDKDRFDSYSDFIKVDTIDENINTAICLTTLSNVERMRKIKHLTANE